MRATAWTCELIDAHVETPTPGAKVLALTIGGSLVPAIWSSNSLESFEAWCHYPKIPASVKARMAPPPGRNENALP